MTSIQTLFIATLLFSLSVNAQITKGNWMVGGSAKFDSNSIKTTLKVDSVQSTQTGKGLLLQPNIGYFIADKFVVGVTPSLSMNFSNEKTFTSYAFGGFTRYYFLKSDKLINILSQIEYLYGPKLNSGTSVENLGFKGGPVIFFNESVALEMTLNYNIVKYDSDSSISKFNTFNIGIGFQIHLEQK